MSVDMTACEKLLVSFGKNTWALLFESASPNHQTVFQLGEVGRVMPAIAVDVLTRHPVFGNPSAAGRIRHNPSNVAIQPVAGQ